MHPSIFTGRYKAPPPLLPVFYEINSYSPFLHHNSRNAKKQRYMLYMIPYQPLYGKCVFLHNKTSGTSAKHPEGLEKGRYIRILDISKCNSIIRKSIHNLFKYHSKTFNLLNMIFSRISNILILSDNNISNASITFSINFFIIVPGNLVCLAPSFLWSF